MDTLFPESKSLLCLLSLRSTKSVAPKLFQARPKSNLVVFAFHNLGVPHSYFPEPRDLLIRPWPHLYVEDRWPIHFGNSNSQASAGIPFKT